MASMSSKNSRVSSYTNPVSNISIHPQVPHVDMDNLSRKDWQIVDYERINLKLYHADYDYQRPPEVFAFDTSSTVLKLCSELQQKLSGGENRKPFVSLSVEDERTRLSFRPSEEASDLFSTQYTNQFINLSSDPELAREYISKYPQIFPVNVDLINISGSKGNNVVFSARKIPRSFVRDPIMNFFQDLKDSRKIKFEKKVNFKKPASTVPAKGPIPVNMDVPLRDIIDASNLRVHVTYFPPFSRAFKENLARYGEPVPLAPRSNVPNGFQFEPIVDADNDEFKSGRPVTLTYLVNNGLPIDTQMMPDKDHALLFTALCCLLAAVVYEFINGETAEERAQYDDYLAEMRRQSNLQSDLDPIRGDSFYETVKYTLYNSTGIDISSNRTITTEMENVKALEAKQEQFRAEARAFEAKRRAARGEDSNDPNKT